MWQPNAQCASERDFVLGQCEETSSAPERPDPNFKVRYSEQLEWSGTGDDVCGYLDDRRGAEHCDRGGRLKLCTRGMRRSVDGLRKIEEFRMPLRSGVASHNDNGT